MSDPGTRSTPDLLAPLPSVLPPVERAARLPLGFRAGAATAGIKASGKPDLSVVASAHGPLSAAATFTTNRFPSAPVILSKAHLAATAPEGQGRYGTVTALLSTSGCANAATGAPGLSDQHDLAHALATALGTDPSMTLAVSTGLIGTRLPVDKVAPAIARLVADGLRADDAAFEAVSEALRTTDSVAKSAAVRLTLPTPDGRPVTVTVSGVAKGVGMIHPRMATMLTYVLTDAAVAPEALSRILRPAVARTWNQLSVDGDTSTSDTVFLVASGASGAAPVVEGTDDWTALARAIEAVARSLAQQQAADGEGANSLITCQVSGAVDDVEARALARAVVQSSLVKAAFHGRDPNWGRIADALGNAQVADAVVLEMAGVPADEARARGGQRVDLDPSRVRIAIAGHEVFAGLPLPFDKGTVSAAMAGDEVLVRVDMGQGEGAGEAFGCDLSEEYVIENSEYST
ncbi:MAG: bifunctional ornithine acetyltransferase/N-acetylglutamate synthase [Chloroflexota bacterium]